MYSPLVGAGQHRRRPTTDEYTKPYKSTLCRNLGGHILQSRENDVSLRLHDANNMHMQSRDGQTGRGNPSFRCSGYRIPNILYISYIAIMYILPKVICCLYLCTPAPGHLPATGHYSLYAMRYAIRLSGWGNGLFLSRALLSRCLWRSELPSIYLLWFEATPLELDDGPFELPRKTLSHSGMQIDNGAFGFVGNAPQVSERVGGGGRGTS